MKTSKVGRKARLFIPNCNSIGQVIDLPEDLMHYCSRVVRLQDESEVVIWNGENQTFVAQLRYLDKRSAQLSVTDGPKSIAHHELMRPIHVLQALPEGDKMDWIIEKCTEMGAGAFFPIQADRSVVKLKNDRAIKRHQHWLRVCESACLQSERGLLPNIGDIKTFEATLNDWKRDNPKGLLLVFDPNAEVTLNQALGERESTQTSNGVIGICVGPEGGWSDQELAIAAQLNVTAVNFSSRVLRTETFALACLSQLVGLLNLEQSNHDQLSKQP